MFYIFLSGCNSRTIQDIKFKFSVFLSLVEATKFINFKVIGTQVLKLAFSEYAPFIGGRRVDLAGLIFQLTRSENRC